MSEGRAERALSGYSESIANRPAYRRRHRLLGQITLALWFALTPSTVPDWRADPGLRTVAVLPVGEPMPGLHR